MIDDISNYDPQLEIKIINLLFHLELYPPKVIYEKITEILDFQNRWNIWLLGRNFYHVCYGRPRLIIPMCELASLAHKDIIKLSKQSVKTQQIDGNNLNIEYEMEWNSALSISLVTENDDFLSCAPPESVYFYGFLCHYKIVDPTSRFQALENKYNGYQDSNSIEKEIIIQTLFPLLFSCWNIFKEKFPDFLSSILTFVQNNRNQELNHENNNSFNYKLIYDELQIFSKIEYDLNFITPFILFQQSSSDLEEQEDLFIKASERKASLLYQQKKAKESRQQHKMSNNIDQNANENEDEFVNVDDNDDIGIDDQNIADDYNENMNEIEINNQNENESENENENSNENNNDNDNNNDILANDIKIFNEQSILTKPLYLSVSHRFHKIISEDDVDSLQDILAQPNSNFDIRVETTLACCYELLMNKPTLIQLSAFYGSIKCFKFLYLNKASLLLNDFNEDPNSIASFAISGGNIEIIRILLSEKVDFSSALFTSVSYHRDDLFFWFIENAGIEKFDVNGKKFDGMSLMHFAAESNNLSIAQFLIESDIKIDFSSNLDEDNIQTPFNLACNYDCVGIVKMICNHYIDEIPKVAIIDALSVCIASNAADSFSFLIGFTETPKSDGTFPFKISLNEIKGLKEKHSFDGFNELGQEIQIFKILNDFEKKLTLEENKQQKNEK